MSKMYKIFFAIVAAGAAGGALFALWARLFADFGDQYLIFVGLTAAIGLIYGFVNYIFVKSVLRIFVRKFHTLERVLVGTNPNELPNVFISNEIDEIEYSAVRITDQFNRLSTAQTMSARGTGSRITPDRRLSIGGAR
ncbi:MAG: hypothetical protein JRF63_04010 [Deltaproteobacteria bacterium]|nr:hypothetical protein [Deltaproteobacteria bacterium]